MLLTPGPYNSAYFEHSFLARHMGIELVMGPDLFVYDDKVYLKTTQGPKRVDVIYRRLDDDFLDPNVFRADSLLGVPGLMKAYRAGNVTLANAVGTGVADDKAIYPFVEDMIRFYLSEEPILQNVPTYICAGPNDLALRHRSSGRTGGQGGQRIGRLRHADGAVFNVPSSAREFRDKIKANPRNYIAQPVVTLSTCADLDRRGPGPAARRSAALHRQRQIDAGSCRAG